MREKLHAAGMNHVRIQEIATEMCGLLNEQTEWLKRPTGLLTDRSGEEVDGYVQRNNRLRELGEQLSEFDDPSIRVVRVPATVLRSTLAPSGTVDQERAAMEKSKDQDRGKRRER